MQQEEINKLFFDVYLIQNNIYENFYKNLESQNCKLSFESNRNYITVAFRWCLTPEGYAFWEKESIKYTSVNPNPLLINYLPDFMENLKRIVIKYKLARF